MLNADRNQLRHSAQTKKDAAKALLTDKQSHPMPAAYLSHVALECALKRRILINNKVSSLKGLERMMPKQTFESLFSGSTGHDLHHLERTANLQRFLTASGNESLLKETSWRSMGGNRPYSLRYGVEVLDTKSVKELVNIASKLTDLMLKDSV